MLELIDLDQKIAKEDYDEQFPTPGAGTGRVPANGPHGRSAR